MPEKNTVSGGSLGVVLQKTDITSTDGELGEVVYHDGTGNRSEGPYVYYDSRWISTNSFN